MPKLNCKNLFCLLGIVASLLSFLCMTHAGTSRSNVVHSRSVWPSASGNYTNYSDPRSSHLAKSESRSAQDHHGRTLILKSLILAPLAMVVFIILLVLLIPIPVISSPLGRSLQAPLPGSKAIQMAREILTADECVERVSCELSRISRSSHYTSWIPPTLEKLLEKNPWTERIIRGLQGNSNAKCTEFTCSPSKTIKRSYQNHK